MYPILGKCQCFRHIRFSHPLNVNVITPMHLEQYFVSHEQICILWEKKGWCNNKNCDQFYCYGTILAPNVFNIFVQMYFQIVSLSNVYKYSVHWHTCCTNLWMLEGKEDFYKKNKCVTCLACVPSSNTAAESWPHLCSDCVNVSRSDTCVNQKKQIKFYPGQEKYADTATSNQDRPPEGRGHWFRGTVRPEAVQHNTRKLFQEDGRMSFFDLLIS